MVSLVNKALIGRKQHENISGDIIDSSARRYVRSLKQYKSPITNNKDQYAMILKKNAFCVLVKPLRDGGMKCYPIQSIHGDRIQVYADEHKLKGITTGSSKHKIQNYRHMGNAYAVILIALRYLHV